MPDGRAYCGQGAAVCQYIRMSHHAARCTRSVTNLPISCHIVRVNFPRNKREPKLGTRMKWCEPHPGHMRKKISQRSDSGSNSWILYKSGVVEGRKMRRSCQLLPWWSRSVLHVPISLFSPHQILNNFTNAYKHYHYRAN